MLIKNIIIYSMFPYPSFLSSDDLYFLDIKNQIASLTLFIFIITVNIAPISNYFQTLFSDAAR